MWTKGGEVVLYKESRRRGTLHSTDVGTRRVSCSPVLVLRVSEVDAEREHTGDPHCESGRGTPLSEENDRKG